MIRFSVCNPLDGRTSILFAVMIVSEFCIEIII
jgi:hypothetical protein